MLALAKQILEFAGLLIAVWPILKPFLKAVFKLFALAMGTLALWIVRLAMPPDLLDIDQLLRPIRRFALYSLLTIALGAGWWYFCRRAKTA